MAQDSQTPVPSELQNTLSWQSQAYVFKWPPTEPMYIPLRDGLVLHQDVELWVNEEMQSEEQLSLCSSTCSQTDDEVQERTADQHNTNLEEFKELAPQKKVAKRHWHGWPSLYSGLAIVGIGILVGFYLNKCR